MILPRPLSSVGFWHIDRVADILVHEDDTTRAWDDAQNPTARRIQEGRRSAPSHPIPFGIQIDERSDKPVACVGDGGAGRVGMGVLGCVGVCWGVLGCAGVCWGVLGCVGGEREG